MCLFCCLCPAQQPDVRVQLWTLFQFSEVEIQPVDKMSIAFGARIFPQNKPTTIRAHGDTVEISGRSGSKTVVSGDFAWLLGERRFNTSTQKLKSQRGMVRCK
jgi:hypothetical protein